MKTSPLLRLALIAASLTAFLEGAAHAQTLVDDWTLNEVGGFTDVSGNEYAVDSVGTNTFGLVYNNSNFGTFGTSSIGGPSTNPIYLPSGGLGWYDPTHRSTFPTNDFTVSLYLETTNLSQTSVIFSSDSNNAGSFTIGMKGGDFVAILNNGSGSLTGTTIGSFTATTADTKLSVTDINGYFTFTDNGVNSASLLATDISAAPISGVMIGIPPGGSPDYNGYISDVTITAGVTSVPEPSAYLMMGTGLVGLAALRRFRKSSAV